MYDKLTSIYIYIYTYIYIYPRARVRVCVYVYVSADREAEIVAYNKISLIFFLFLKGMKNDQTFFDTWFL
jgi:hypothetical protein